MKPPVLGLYIHVPFCTNRCDYCHFYKRSPSQSAIQQFFQNIQQERDYWQFVWEQRPFETIFWGGGNPSCLTPDELIALGNLCPTSENLKEWSVEVSPMAINQAKLQALHSLPVTRLSMGIQSFNPTILHQLGRRQTPTDAFKAYDALRSAGFNNINLDLIFPPDFSDLTLWRKDLETAISLNPEHLSTYCLTYETTSGPFTPQHHQTVDIDKEASFYLFTWDFLNAHGYQQYEVSNFAKPGFECRHNKNTWLMQEWLGWGPSAASQWNHQRFQNPTHLPYTPGPHNATPSLTPDELCKDHLIFGLRLCEGINLSELQKQFPSVNLECYQSLWQHFCAQGLTTLDHSILRCTQRGMLLADSLAVAILLR